MNIDPKLAAFLGPVVAINAIASVYMTDEQAVKTIFPSQGFKKLDISLDDNEVGRIEKASGQRVRNSALLVWKNQLNEVVFVDQVLGKHELIKYAVGLTREGKVKGVEILEYRESYGHQIRNEAWRRQFVGKDKDAPLKLDGDVTNISGATLSSSHVTAGVKRILQTYDAIKARL